jgi:hypothetical protein
MILPLAAMFFVAIHFWRIRKDGGLYAHSSEPSVLRANGAKRVWAEGPTPLKDVEQWAKRTEAPEAK